jgi:hypothetical protein
MRIEALDRAWLAASGLVDPDVDLSRVSLHTGGVPTWWVRTRGRSAMTIGNHIWFSTPAKARSRGLLVHEFVHVGQYHRMTVPVFLVRYFAQLAGAGFRYSKRLPLEAPAYARQALVEISEQGRAGVGVDPTG